jgi:glycogen debranching enzyme
MTHPLIQGTGMLLPMLTALAAMAVGSEPEGVDHGSPSVALGSAAISASATAPFVHGSLKIGPFYPQTANGITWIVDDRAAYHLAVGFAERDKLQMEYTQLQGWRPLAAATDSSYYANEWKIADATVRLRWSAQAGGLVTGMIESDRDIQVALIARPSWRDYQPVVYHVDAVTGLSAPAAGGLPGWCLRTMTPPIRQCTAASSGSLTSGLMHEAVATTMQPDCWAGQLFAVSPSAPLRFCANIGNAAGQSGGPSIETRLAQAQRTYEAATPKDPDLEAIQVAMNISRLYSPILKSVVHTISRGWCKDDEIRLFGWDSFFNGLLAIRVDPVTARDTIRGILATATPEGYIPNVGSDRSQGKPNNRSEPPVGAMAVWNMHTIAADRGFLEEVYPKLVAWHTWWFSAGSSAGSMPVRDGNGNGLLEWGCANGQAQDVKYESGMDDSPMFDEMEVDPISKTMRMDAVDLSALWAMDAEYLGKIAEALGRPGDVQRFQAEVSDMNRKLNELCWNDQAGFYANRYWTPRIESFRVPLATVSATCVTTPTGAPGVQVEYFRDSRMRVVSGAETIPVPELTDGQVREAITRFGDEGGNLRARLSATVSVSQDGLYALSVEGRGSSSLWMDGHLTLEQSRLMPPSLRTQPIPMKAGDRHGIRIEYQTKNHHGVRLSWCRLPDPAPTPQYLSDRCAVTCFYPLITGAPDPVRAQRMLQAVRDEGQFWGTYVLPTISRADPAFPGQHYWRGKIWGPTNYLAWLGLKRYGDPTLLAEFAEKCETLFMKNWREGRRYHENFFCDGTGSNDPHYTWGALLALIHYEYTHPQVGLMPGQ